IYGDYLSADPIAPDVERLTGVKYGRQEIRTAVGPWDLTHYFGRISPADLIELSSAGILMLGPSSVS
ncbi:hypothetical protein WP50_26990, partial [Lactiplantibacillus plantarum]